MRRYVPLGVWLFVMALMVLGAFTPRPGWDTYVFIFGMSVSGALALFNLSL